MFRYTSGNNTYMNIIIRFLFVPLLGFQVHNMRLYFVNVDTNLPRSIHFYAYNFVIMGPKGKKEHTESMGVLLVLDKYAVNCENIWFE